jgi:hypothetical protein
MCHSAITPLGSNLNLQIDRAARDILLLAEYATTLRHS